MNRLAMMVLKNILAVPGLYVKLCHYAKNADKYPEAESWAHIRKIMQLAVKSGNVDLVVTGLENLPAEDGYLLVANHQGLFDVVALVAAHERPLGAVYKKELEGMPFIREIAACTRSFAMDREDVRQSLKVIQGMTQELEKGRSQLIFPEGTRSKQGNVMGEFHGGSFRCAVKSKATIVPFAVIDCFKVLDQKGSKPVTAQLHFLEPIPFAEYEGMKTTEIAAMVKSRVQACIDENT